MKKAVSTLLCAILVFSACIPSFAQKSRSLQTLMPKAESIEFARTEAFTEGQGTLVRWEMKGEKDNVGFYVYRVSAKGTRLLNQSLILGADARAGGPAADTGYSFYDPQGSMGVTYMIEAAAVDGRRISSATFSTQYTVDLKSSGGRTRESLENAERTKSSNIQKNDLALPEDLATTVQAGQQLADPVTHAWVVAQPGAKISVRKEGMYRITRAQLQAAGFNVAGNSANWRLFMEGVEQAIIVGAGDQYIEFYGKGIDTPESDTRMYYLVADATPGKRIQPRLVRPIGGNVVSSNYRLTAIKKERTSYINKILNGDAENYWGRIVSSSPTTLNFDLSGVDADGAKAIVTINMQGYTTVPHSVKAVLNGSDLDPLAGDSQFPFSRQYSISPGQLVEGVNTLQMTSLGVGDFSLFDSISVTYSRKYQADQNKVTFYTPGYRKTSITGFTTPNVRVFDTTYDSEPQLISNFPIVQEGATFTAKLPADRAGVFYGVEDSALLVSPAVAANNPSTLTAPSNEADMVIISYSAPDFMAAAEAWAVYRRSAAGGNYKVKVIDVADIYDEFNYGVMSADSINRFLKFTQAPTTHWQTSPHYVLFLGDASYDPRNYEGFGYLDLVPTKMITLIYGESSSDEALADFDNDGLAEMAIGRIPSRTAAGVTIAFNKTKKFEEPANQAFSRGAIFAYDLPISYDFEAMSLILKNELPTTMPIIMIGRSDPDAHNRLITEISLGRLIVNYCGHGASGLWAGSDFFTNGDVPALTNINKPSIFTMLTCLTGYFIRPDADSMSELLVLSPNGGAAAAWASTTETTPNIQLDMGTRFFNQVKAGNITRLGDLIRDSKQTIAGSEVSFSWNLFGDPLLKVTNTP